MSGKIGKNRLFTLIVFAGMALALGGLAYFVLNPIFNNKNIELQSVQSENSQISTDIADLKNKIDLFEKQKIIFEKISKKGFLDDQNRVLARTRFQSLQKLSKVVSAEYQISSAIITEDPLSKESGYVMMVSPIKINISAIHDLDIYRFIYYLNYAYPGHVLIKEMIIDRKMNVDPEVLKKIGTNSPPVLVDAVIEMEWTTLAKKESIPPDVLNAMTSSPQ